MERTRATREDAALGPIDLRVAVDCGWPSDATEGDGAMAKSVRTTAKRVVVSGKYSKRSAAGSALTLRVRKPRTTRVPEPLSVPGMGHALREVKDNLIR